MSDINSYSFGAILHLVITTPLSLPTLCHTHMQSSPLAAPTMVQSVVSCVKLLCERMSFIEPPEITDAVFNLRRACKAASQPDIEASSLFNEVFVRVCACVCVCVCLKLNRV